MWCVLRKIKTGLRPFERDISKFILHLTQLSSWPLYCILSVHLRISHFIRIHFFKSVVNVTYSHSVLSRSILFRKKLAAFLTFFCMSNFIFICLTIRSLVIFHHLVDLMSCFWRCKHVAEWSNWLSVHYASTLCFFHVWLSVSVSWSDETLVKSSRPTLQFQETEGRSVRRVLLDGGASDMDTRPAASCSSSRRLPRVIDAAESHSPLSWFDFSWWSSASVRRDRIYADARKRRMFVRSVFSPIPFIPCFFLWRL